LLHGRLGRHPHTTPLLGAPLALAGACLAFAGGFDAEPDLDAAFPEVSGSGPGAAG
jgi:hypothetical protein